MILPAGLGLLGVLLLAIGTPRQAASLFGPAFVERRRRAVRIGGFGCIAIGFVFLMAAGGDARAIVGWIGLLAVDALALALTCSVFKPWNVRRSGHVARTPDRREPEPALSGLSPVAPRGSGGVTDQDEDI